MYMPIFNKICPQFPTPPSGKSLADCLDLLRKELFHRKNASNVLYQEEEITIEDDDSPVNSSFQSVASSTNVLDALDIDVEAMSYPVDDDDDDGPRNSSCQSTSSSTCDEEEVEVKQEMLPSHNFQQLLINNSQFNENPLWEDWYPSGFYAFTYIYVLADKPYTHWSCAVSTSIVSEDKDVDRKGEDR